MSAGLVGTKGVEPMSLFSVCGHGVCDRCLAQRYPIRVSAGGELIWNVNPNDKVICPICDTPGKRSSWSDWSEDISFLEKAEGIRKKVTLVLNADRESFTTTPLYFSFLEEREQIIYDLIYSRDPVLRAEREEFLAQCEISKQKDTLEANERYKKRMEQRIVDIVDKEGVFYEKLKRQLISRNGKGAAFASGNELQNLVHPLQQNYVELFPKTQIISAKEVLQREHEGTDILSFLRQRMPTVMNEYKRKPGDSRARALAGGHSKETVLRRTELETYAFRFDWREE